jgi:hypothetical protein
MYEITTRRTSQEWLETSSDELREVIRDIAEIGYYAFCRIFRDDELREEMKNILGQSSHLVLGVVADPTFAAPWELMCSEKPNESSTATCLWGMRHIIKRMIPHNGSRLRLSADIEYSGNPQICLVADASLQYVKDREIPFLENAAKSGKIDLFRLRTLIASQRREELDYFVNHLRTQFHLVHFACHAVVDVEMPGRSYINVPEDFHFALSDMEVRRPVFSEDGPLVFLNACETGNLNPLYTSSFVNAILNAGARGVIATECPIPDEFAADFAVALLTSLFEGKELGQSLLQARREFWEKYHNPTGLLYSLYADPSIRLKRLNWRAGHA